MDAIHISTSAIADISNIDWDEIFKIDFVEESDSEEENSDSEDDRLQVNEGMFFPGVKTCFRLSKKSSKFVLLVFHKNSYCIHLPV